MAKSRKHPFSHTETWQKLRQIKGIKQLVDSALILYSLLLDADTPTWVKTVCITAIAYLVFPTDSIPDAFPALGYSDDLLCLSAAISAVANYIQPHHKDQANDIFNQL
mgnify:CR=1 FL=1